MTVTDRGHAYIRPGASIPFHGTDEVPDPVAPEPSCTGCRLLRSVVTRLPGAPRPRSNQDTDRLLRGGRWKRSSLRSHTVRSDPRGEKQGHDSSDELLSQSIGLPSAFRDDARADWQRNLRAVREPGALRHPPYPNHHLSFDGGVHPRRARFGNGEGVRIAGKSEGKAASRERRGVLVSGLDVHPRRSVDRALAVLLPAMAPG